jgi:selenide,water dikinase
MKKLPVMSEALAMYRRGVTTGVNSHNRRMVRDALQFEGDWPAWQREIFFDPQTSGGLLAAVAPEIADDLVAALHKAGVAQACRIGEILPFRETGIYLQVP